MTLDAGFPCASPSRLVEWSLQDAAVLLKVDSRQAGVEFMKQQAFLERREAADRFDVPRIHGLLPLVKLSEHVIQFAPAQTSRRNVWSGR